MAGGILDILSGTFLDPTSEKEKEKGGAQDITNDTYRMNTQGFNNDFINVNGAPQGMPVVYDRQVVKKPVPQQMSNNQGSMNAMDMMGKYPQNLASGAVDTAWNSQKDQRTPPVEEPSFMDKVGSGISDFFGDEERMARMTIALNSMRLNPDPNIAKSMENKLERLQTNKGRNATVIKLREKGRNDLADAVESGALKATDAWTLAFKPPSAFQEKLDFIKDKTPEEVEMYKELGILGGGTTINMGDKDYHKNLNKNVAESQKLWTERGANARSTLNTLAELDRAISNFGETGPDQETKQTLRTIASKLNMTALIDEDRMSDAQYIEAIKNRLVAEQLRMNKGPQTDFDAKFAGTYIPGLGTGTEANQKLLSYGQSIALQQRILSDMSANILTSDAADSRALMQEIIILNNGAAGAIGRKDGSYMTFQEFFSSDANVVIKDEKGQDKEVSLMSLSPPEKLRQWVTLANRLAGY